MATTNDDKYENVGIHHDENSKSEGDVTPPQREVIEYEAKEEKKLIRKIDGRLLPILGALYSIALIDRVNISAARISGMEKDLQLYIGDRYTIALVVLFPTLYGVRVTVKYRSPQGRNSKLAGVHSLRVGHRHAWDLSPATLHWLHADSCWESSRPVSSPDVHSLITCWYVRYEVQQRLAWFYLVSVLVGGFSNILAYGLIQMDGLQGIAGWQWIFIIEGILTQVVAIGAWFLIVDFPDKAHRKGLLTEREATFVAQRIDIDRGDSKPDPLTLERLMFHLKDFKLWMFALMFMSTTMPAYALAYFAPVIVYSMGYSVGVTHLLGVPPIVFAVISSLLISWASDKYKKRCPAIAFQCLMGITGLMMTAYCKGNIARYWGLFFGQAGCQGNIPSILAYQSNNIRTQSKRSVGSALQIGFGAIGGIMGSTVFRQQDAPRYVIGLWVTAGLQMFILTLLSIMTTYFYTMNKKVDNGTLKKPLEGQPGFKFTY